MIVLIEIIPLIVPVGLGELAGLSELVGLVELVGRVGLVRLQVLVKLEQLLLVPLQSNLVLNLITFEICLIFIRQISLDSNFCNINIFVAQVSNGQSGSMPKSLTKQSGIATTTATTVDLFDNRTLLYLRVTFLSGYSHDKGKHELCCFSIQVEIHVEGGRFESHVRILTLLEDGAHVLRKGQGPREFVVSN